MGAKTLDSVSREEGKKIVRDDRVLPDELRRLLQLLRLGEEKTLDLVVFPPAKFGGK